MWMELRVAVLGDVKAMVWPRRPLMVMVTGDDWDVETEVAGLIVVVSSIVRGSPLARRI